MHASVYRSPDLDGSKGAVALQSFHEPENRNA